MMQRRDSTVSSNHDNDSLFDMYGGQRMSTVSGVSSDLGPHTGGDEAGSYITSSIGSAGFSRRTDEREPEASKWIHRDKLAKIEGNEAADYMYDVGSSRWIHKDKLERIEIHELQRAGVSPEDLPILQDGPDTQRLGIPTPSASDEGDARFYELNADIRTPEEQAAGARYNPYRQFRRNPSYSRIPLASASPHPIPQQFIERISPLPRNTASPTDSDDHRVSITLPAARKRSHSASSAQLLEAATTVTAQINGSPARASATIVNPKTRVPNNRRTSNTNSRTGSMAGKQRTRSNPQLHRPNTSASYAATHANSPHSNSKSPEGPPPWALQGYKPDPSLPQDQQIIPTVAKKLQQEQWERDGVSASVYDREFRPLKVASDTEKSPQLEGQEPSWPLANQDEQNPTETPPPQQVDAGYKTMPNVCNIPRFPGMQLTSEQIHGVPETRAPMIQKVPLATPEDEKKKSKMCCCIIM